AAPSPEAPPRPRRRGRRGAPPLRSPPWLPPPRPWSSSRRKRRTRTEHSARPESPLRHTSGPEHRVPGHSCIHIAPRVCRGLSRRSAESSVYDRWLWFHIELSVAERALGRCQTRCSSRVHPDASQLLASHFSCSRPGIVVSLV